ncbi:MAG: bifunctional UDP-N-acetylmuramoyl-tripeptide:D-alanyl-D-alanine ligase/alanine racemase [Flavobacteriales bacterium]|nr:bifunctional UDP-N-acetylmuramoyl-tripeptide:D-alanyl-D-alanine ligase/alanine racemase [Flavobacteriales bacterium]
MSIEDGYEMTQIADWLQGEASLKIPGRIRYLMTDSRKGADLSHSLFFALKGSAHDGHGFIPELFGKGYRHFVVEHMPDDQRLLDQANFIRVPDTMAALQKLAKRHRDQFSCPVIGITGSNGKTIVKEWLYQLMQEDKAIVRSPRSYNSQLGVALSVWMMAPQDELAIFEAGISQPGEMQALSRMIAPTIGLITNIGHAHDEHFKDHIQKTTEKLKLFHGCKSLIYCRDHSLIHEQVMADPALKEVILLTWSRVTKADLIIGKTKQDGPSTSIQATYHNKFINITIPFTDEASVENAIHCWLVMLHLGYDPETINNRMRFLNAVAMRLELKEGIHQCSVINDFYNSDLESLTIALDFLNQQQQHAKRTVILSDLLQSGLGKEQLYREIAQRLERRQVDRLIGVGPDISSQSGLFKGEKQFYPDTDAFLAALPGLPFHEETILLKGARSFGFERISRLLQQKAHDTVLEVNLGALIRNLNIFRSKLEPGTRIMAMVKAFSYGSGTYEVANALQFHRVDYLAVAYADEGMALRKAGITLPIMVMSPQPASFDTMFMHTLEAEIYSLSMLDTFIEAAQRRHPDLTTRVPIHIKIDTGMHRLGFLEEELNQMIVKIRNSRILQIKSIFTHLAASDEPVHDDFSHEQIQRFKRCADAVQPHFAYPIMRHVLNTSGIQRFPEAQFDMVRLGIGLYGLTPVGGLDLHPAGTLKTTITQIKKVQPGDSIGYGRTDRAEKPMDIATVPIGYADGYNRRLGNGRCHMLVNGKPAPTIGNICMDMCMLDVTGMIAREGDEVIAFGDGLPISILAQAAETIPYEILAAISQRVKRVYYQE